MQIHRGTRYTDSFASRQATLLFNAGTSAELVLADETTVAAGTFHIRATEFTRGDLGPAAMPAELPSTSQYTYCVDFGADEEASAGATGIQFNQPVVFYLENILDLPVRSRVPVGIYDRVRGEWRAEEDGIVLEVLSETAGKADLDLDGDGIAEGPSTFAVVGITDDELEAVASLYEPGQTLWRTVRLHFDTIDPNLPFAPRAGEGTAQQFGVPGPKGSGDKKDPCLEKIPPGASTWRE